MKNKRFWVSGVGLLVVLVAGQANAADQKAQLGNLSAWFAPRTVFVTPAIYDGYLGGLTGADEICNTHANAPGSIVPQGNYVAILSDSNTSAASRVGVSMGPIINSLGEPVAENVTDLFSGVAKQFRSRPDPDNFEARYVWKDDGNPLSSPINRTASGERVAWYTWTGSQPNGQPASDDPTELCSGWTTADASKSGSGVGATSQTTTAWITAEEVIQPVPLGCNEPKGLYCLQSID